MRIAIGDLENRCPEGGRELARGKTKRDVPLHIRAGKRPERKLAPTYTVEPETTTAFAISRR